jgi:hypothetical protein
VQILSILVIFAVGIMTGLGLTWLSSAGGTPFAAIQIGAWTTWPRSGTADIDPYSRAGFARSGELPIERADGIAFETANDDSGNRLDGRCETRIAGRLPSARFWTLTAYDARGRLIENAAGRYGYNSTEIIWSTDGSFEVLLAPRARSGNWIPTGNNERISLVLRLYDAPVGLASRSGEPVELPRITQVKCP